ncbi:hypothetical protein EJ03DRAFT_24955 [Teratosphaeria nubilosa]|uniref:Uncharacterized protein n=1 Tax=Teratosphaeria nubilosa TaxID=161662 RepID=A0A6G1LGM7_9PEZI|nr:hypothetical protein EJ03DRAFT_24955 [Teratosphaeria nubilosa]
MLRLLPDQSPLHIFIVIFYCASSITTQILGGAAFRWLVSVALDECAASIPAHVALIRGRRMETQGQAATDPGACLLATRTERCILRTRDETSGQASSHLAHLARPTQPAKYAQKFLVDVGCDDSHDAELQLGFTCLRLLLRLRRSWTTLSSFTSSHSSKVFLGLTFSEDPAPPSQDDSPGTCLPPSFRLSYSAPVPGTEPYIEVDFFRGAFNDMPKGSFRRDH